MTTPLPARRSACHVGLTVPFYGLRHKERYQTKAADALLDLIAERARG